LTRAVPTRRSTLLFSADTADTVVRSLKQRF
jgi:hypothetical protein